MEIAVSSQENKGNEDDEHGNIKQWLGNPLEQKYVNDGYDYGHTRHHGNSLPAVLQLDEVFANTALLIYLLVDNGEGGLNVITSWEAVTELKLGIIV